MYTNQPAKTLLLVTKGPGTDLTPFLLWEPMGQPASFSQVQRVMTVVAGVL